MNINGCTNPKAANYNPSADQDDGSCVYLHKIGDTCYAFQDYIESSLRDQSFTLSYSVDGNAWVFYHDYIPDFYFSTRQQLFTLKNNFIWKHNAGPFGKFYKTNKDSFFVDIVFNFKSEVLLNSIQWITKVIDSSSKIHDFKTFTHITVWNDKQCTGKIPISQYAPIKPEGISKHSSEFSFNELRDIVSTSGEFFMKSLFENFAPEPTTLDNNMPWYHKSYLQNNYFIVRLEFDNTDDKAIYLHSADVAIDQTVR